MEDISMAVTLKKEVVVDEWWTLVEGAADKVEQVFKDTEDNIKNSKAPDVSFERVKVSSSFLGGVFGGQRDFIHIKDKHLPKFDMYIGVRQYGTHLDCTWYLTNEPGLIWRLINMALVFFKRKLVLNLTLFDEHDLRVYATVVHHCFRTAVEKITKVTGQEIPKSSKGFLGIS